MDRKYGISASLVHITYSFWNLVAFFNGLPPLPCRLLASWHHSAINSILALISVRKELKIRPGFTPQEDQTRFRGSRQAAAEQSARPKGHIPGWVPPSNAASTKPKPKTTTTSNIGGRSLEALAAAGEGLSSGLAASSQKQEKEIKPVTKSAKKTAKKKGDKQKALEDKIKAAWDDDSEDDIPTPAKKGKSTAQANAPAQENTKDDEEVNKDKDAEAKKDEDTEELTEKVAALNV
jgi:partner of Y14 and mago protein